MKKICLPIIFILLIAFCVPSYAEQDPKEILKAVVKIKTIIPNDARSARTLGTQREGSGVLIDSNGHIITIGYLINEAESIQVFGPESKAIDATFVAYDQSTGFGLLKVNTPLSVTPMELGQSSEVKQGDPVLVASHGGADSVLGARVISRKEFAGYWEYLLEDAIFTSPPHPNFGGAALIGRNGRLLGIGSLFSQIMIQGLGSIACNVFVPIDLLKPILSDLIIKGRSSEPPRPWLGLNVEEAHGRIFITRVTDGGPADKAGLQVGDMILSVNKTEVKGIADLYRKVWSLGDAGVDVPLSILRGIQIKDIIVPSDDRTKFYRARPQKTI